MKKNPNPIYYIISLLILVGIIVSAFNTSCLLCASGVSSVQNLSLLQSGKPDGTKIADTKTKNETETVRSKNAVKKIWDEDGTLTITADLVDDKQEVKITVYNMLGKEIRKLYHGLPKDKSEEGYYIFTSPLVNLPKNIYLLVIQGATFKIASKFIIAK